MKYFLVVVAVLFIAVYGFKFAFPTSNGTLVIKSGYEYGEER